MRVAWDSPRRYNTSKFRIAEKENKIWQQQPLYPRSIRTSLKFVSRTHKILINGKWVDSASGKTFPTYNPATGEVLSRVAEGDKEDINRAVKAARAAFDSGPWSKITPSERGRMIWRLADLIEKHLEEFAQIESAWTTENRSPSRVLPMCPLRPITFATWQDGPPRLKAIRFPFRPAAERHNFWPTRSANLSESSDKSFRGISRC